jgi:iron complex outermembrane receptor protein
VAARHQWAVRGAWFEDILNYRDGGSPSNSRVRTTQAQAEHTSGLGARGSLRLGAEAQHFAAWVSGYGTAEVVENRAAGFALLRFDPRPNLRLTANVRQAVLPAGLAPLTPTAGLEWDLFSAVADSLHGRAGQHLTAKASAARSYRAPTLNERYYLPGGNPNLRPELCFGYEVGLQHRIGTGRGVTLETELTAFRQDVDDWVQWLPMVSVVGANYYSPRNLRRVRSQGLEATTALRRSVGRYTGTVQLAYHFTDTRKTEGLAADSDPVGVQLAFVPLHQASLGTDHRWRDWLVSSTLVFTSFRYITASGTDFLPATGLLGATLGRTLRGPAGTSLLLLVQATNLLNQAYDSYPGRPAPPRAFSASLRVGWH